MSRLTKWVESRDDAMTSSEFESQQGQPTFVIEYYRTRPILGLLGSPEFVTDV